MWLNYISRISTLIHNVKMKFVYAGVIKTIGLSLMVIFLELYLLIISLPVYIFIAPEKISDNEKEVEKYRLKRKLSLLGVAGFLLIIILKMTLFSGLFVSSPKQVSALSFSWNFEKPENYIYNRNWIKILNDKTIFDHRQDGQTIQEPLNATIEPKNSLKVPNIIQWTGFVEDAQKNDGNTYYQLSRDDGQTWHYWNGKNWTVAGEGDYNKAAVINKNIQNFQPINEQIKFRAFFASHQAAEIVLNNLKITYTKVMPGDYGVQRIKSDDKLWIHHEFDDGYWIFGIKEEASAMAIDSKGECVKYDGEVRKCSQGDYALLISLKNLLKK